MGDFSGGPYGSVSSMPWDSTVKERVRGGPSQRLVKGLLKLQLL